MNKTIYIKGTDTNIYEVDKDMLNNINKRRNKLNLSNITEEDLLPTDINVKNDLGITKPLIIFKKQNSEKEKSFSIYADTYHLHDDSTFIPEPNKFTLSNKSIISDTNITYIISKDTTNPHNVNKKLTKEMLLSYLNTIVNLYKEGTPHFTIAITHKYNKYKLHTTTITDNLDIFGVLEKLYQYNDLLATNKKNNEYLFNNYSISRL